MRRCARIFLSLCILIALPAIASAAGFDPKNTDHVPLPPQSPSFAVPKASFSLLPNGSFEDGNFAPWTPIDYSLSGRWLITDAPTAPLSGWPLQPAADGTFQAVYDQFGAATSILYTDVFLPTTSQVTWELVLWYENYAGVWADPGTLDWTVGINQQIRIDVMDPLAPVDDVGAGVWAPLFATIGGDPNSLPPTVMSWDLSPWAGQKVRLRIAAADNLDYLTVGVDAIALRAEIDQIWASASTRAPVPVSIFCTPDGSVGYPLSSAQLFGGGSTDATIDVWLYDAFGNPIEGYPAEGIKLGTSLGNVAFCTNQADGPTDPSGWTRFGNLQSAMGHTEPNLGELTLVELPGLLGVGAQPFVLDSAFRQIYASVEQNGSSSKSTALTGDWSETVTNDWATIGTAADARQDTRLMVSEDGVWASGTGEGVSRKYNYCGSGAYRGASGSSTFDIEFTLDSFAEYQVQYSLQENGSGATAEILLETSGGDVILLDSGVVANSIAGILAPDSYRLRVYADATKGTVNNQCYTWDASFDFEFDVSASTMLYNPRLLGANVNGDLFEIDPAAGIINPLCPIFSTSEIEFDPMTGEAWGHVNGGFGLQAWSPDPCGPVGALIPNNLVFQGLEYAMGHLYGTTTGNFSSCAAPTELHILDPPAGTTTLVGPTGVDGPISGLAWNPHTKTMYGVTGCKSVGTSDLLVIDLSTGAASLVGNTQINAGSLEFGADGQLYAGDDLGQLWRINPANGAASFVLNTGLASALSGLALVSDKGLNISMNSTDINGDGTADISDIALFAGDLAGAYDYRSDFVWDGLLDLSDITQFTTGLNISCPAPGPGAVQLVREDGRADVLGIRFEGSSGSQPYELSPGQTGVAWVTLRGPAAETGVEGWEAELVSSPNLELLSFELPEKALDLGKGSDHWVGYGQPLSARQGSELQLARIEFRVTDAQPAWLDLRPSGLASLGDAVPVVVSGAEAFGLVVDADEGGHTAYVNGRSDQSGEHPGRLQGLALRAAPNPFNPRTQIRFNMLREGAAQVRIYDAAGRTVRLIDAGFLSAGAQALDWDGRDDQGGNVSSGLYFARLTLNGTVQDEVLKLTLLK